jgi:hypothetical protein
MFEAMPFMEKQMWNARAEEDKQRYAYEIDHYSPSPSYDSKGDHLDNSLSEIKATPSPVVSSQKRLPKKDPRFPKRYLSAFLMYQKSLRQELKDNPAMTLDRISQNSSDKFKNLGEEEKAVWIRKAQEDKNRYEREIAKYVPFPGYDRNGHFIDENSGKGKRKARALKDVNSPKRAAGAYVFFANEVRPKLQAENPGVKFVDIGRILGQRWRALTDKEKEPYDKASAEDKARYRRQMAEYKERRPEEDSHYRIMRKEATPMRATSGVDNFMFPSGSMSSLKSECN